MGKKYYAVKQGKVPGIYETWEECKEQVHGYSGAEYKSFELKSDAVAFIKGEAENIKSEREAVAYTDGSYNVSNGHFSYGIVFFHKGEKLTFSQEFDIPELSSMRNVAGEIAGATRAMEYCVENGIKSLEILYDYEGVEKWCTGAWKTNKPGTIAYKASYDKFKELLKVTFTKVKGHSGNKYNDEADRLAKDALGIK